MSRFSKSSPRAMVVVIALLLALLVGESAVLAATVKKSGGAVTAVRTAVDQVGVSTTSTQPVDVPGMSVNMRVPEGQRALFIITFSANVGCSTTYFCWVSARVDGNAASSGVFLMNYSPGLVTTSVQFVAGPIGAGDHVVKLQYFQGATGGGGMMELRYRVMTVLRSRI
jgi:hypothetical protein